MVALSGGFAAVGAFLASSDPQAKQKKLLEIPTHAGMAQPETRALCCVFRRLHAYGRGNPGLLKKNLAMW